MSQFFVVHPDNPQARLLNQAAQIITSGGVVVYPTDTAYALGCSLGHKQALDRIRQIRRLDDKHLFTLMCRDLSDLGLYAKVNNQAFRRLKAHTPGPYTFILEATKEVPRRLQQGKRKQIGVRVPNHNIALGLLGTLNEPLLNTTLTLPGDDYPLTDPYDIKDLLGPQVDLIIDGGYCGIDESTVIDMTDDVPQLIREGLGSFDDFRAS